MTETEKKAIRSKHRFGPVSPELTARILHCYRVNLDPETGRSLSPTVLAQRFGKDASTISHMLAEAGIVVKRQLPDSETLMRRSRLVSRHEATGKWD